MWSPERIPRARTGFSGGTGGGGAVVVLDFHGPGRTAQDGKPCTPWRRAEVPPAGAPDPGSGRSMQAAAVDPNHQPDARPASDGANTEQAAAAPSVSAVTLALSPPDSRAEPAGAVLEPFCLLQDAPPGSSPAKTSSSAATATSSLETASAAATAESSSVTLPSETAPLQAPSAPEAPPRGLFDLRKALKSAVRVLTRERTFTLGGPAAAPPASTAFDDANGAAEADAAAGADAAYDADRDTDPDSGSFAEYETEPERISEDFRPVGLSGHTSTVAMPEVLGFLAQLRKTGTLWIWNDREQYRVQLVDGNVTFARNETPEQGSLLGEILVSHGVIDVDVLENFLKQPREPGPLGDALVRAGLVDRAALTDAVHFQAQRVFNRAYGLADAYFTFDGRGDADLNHAIRISVTKMLFESARERDESEQRLSNVFDDPFAK
jgi:hypothetical protein